MDLPIRQVEIDRTAQTSAVRRSREDRNGEPFEIDADAHRRREREREEPAPERTLDPEDQRIAPRASDEVGAHLDVTA
ncbi:MAG: hypothetical protein IT453_03245 [Planctomycetes bacterium]|nr:hypothetical protein [Planctomycetota bacterium]